MDHTYKVRIRLMQEARMYMCDAAMDAHYISSERMTFALLETHRKNAEPSLPINDSSAPPANKHDESATATALQ